MPTPAWVRAIRRGELPVSFLVEFLGEECRERVEEHRAGRHQDAGFGGKSHQPGCGWSETVHGADQLEQSSLVQMRLPVSRAREPLI